MFTKTTRLLAERLRVHIQLYQAGTMRVGITTISYTTYQVVQITFSYSAVFVSFDACLLVQLFFTKKVIDALAIYLS